MRCLALRLRTSFIVGFPGESAKDFEILEEFIGEAKFDWLGVFNYSDEEGSELFRSARSFKSGPLRHESGG